MPFEIKQPEKLEVVHSDSIADPTLVIYGFIAMLVIYIFRNLFIGIFVFLAKLSLFFGFVFLTYKMFLT